MSLMNQLLTPRQVGDLLGFKPRTITKWCREGKFETAHKVGRVWRVQRRDPDLHRMQVKRSGL